MNKKIASLLLSVVLSLSFATAALAQQVEVEPNDVPTQAGSIANMMVGEVTGLLSLDGTISSYNDNDFFVFLGLSNYKQTVTVTNQSQSPRNYLHVSVFRYSDLVTGSPATSIVQKVIEPSSTEKVEFVPVKGELYCVRLHAVGYASPIEYTLRAVYYP